MVMNGGAVPTYAMVLKIASMDLNFKKDTRRKVYIQIFVFKFLR